MNALLVSRHWVCHHCLPPISSLSLPRICRQPRCLLVSRGWVCQHCLSPISSLSLLRICRKPRCLLVSCRWVRHDCLSLISWTLQTTKVCAQRNGVFARTQMARKSGIHFLKKSVNANFMIIRILMVGGN